MTDHIDNSLKKRLVSLRNAAIEEYRTDFHPQRLLKTLCRNVDKILIDAWKEGTKRGHNSYESLTIPVIIASLILWQFKNGKVAEWSNAPDSKSGIR